MSNEGQRYYELIQLAFTEDNDAIVKNGPLLDFLVENKDTRYTIDDKSQTLPDALDEWWSAIPTQTVGTLLLNPITALNLVSNGTSIFEVFNYLFANYIQEKTNAGNTLTFPEIKYLFKFKADLSDAFVSILGFIAISPWWGKDYYTAFFEKVKENPNLIPAGGVISSYNDFDAEATERIRKAGNVSVTVAGLYFQGIGNMRNTVALLERNDYEKAGGQNAIRVDGTDLIDKTVFEEMVVAKPNELNPLKNPIMQQSINQIAPNGISNLSNFPEVEPIILDAWIEYLENVLTADNPNVDSAFISNVQTVVTKALPFVIKPLENARRKALWLEIQSRSAEDVAADEDLLQDAQAAAASALADAGLVGGIEIEDLSEEEIRRRQRFYQQCVLMVKMEDLKDNLVVSMGLEEDRKIFHSSGIYDERFYMVNGENNSSFINTILSSKGDDVNQFLSITPDIQAFFVPKLRIYKVYESEGVLKQLEFFFPDSSLKNDKMKEMFLDDSISFRGGGFGIKSFSFSFDGTTPATARNDITAKLSLFFQDFSDFIKPFKTKNDSGEFEEFRFVDMILFDTSKAAENPKITYDPSYYRIRADVGWHIPTSEYSHFNKVCDSRGLDPEKIKRVMRESNKTFYLNMVDHTINFNDEGTVSIDIDYRAYIESALKGGRFDALSNKEISDRRKERQEALKEAYADKCTEEDIAKLKRLFAAEAIEEKKFLYRRLLNDLENFNKIYSIEVKDDGGYRLNGFFERAPVINKNPETVSNADSDLPTDESIEEEENRKIPTSYVTSDPDNTIQFFYLGDLFYLTLDSIFYETSTIKNTRFVLPSITIEDFFNANNEFDINLAEIPISVRYFSEWYNEYVIKRELTTYPIMYFIRDFLNNLVVDTLIDTCLNKDYDKSFVFTTMSALNHKNAFAGKATFPDKEKGGGPKIDLVSNLDIFPFTTDQKDIDTSSGDINDIFNYIFVVPQYNSIKNIGTGDYTADLDRGVLHFGIGMDRGLLKTAKFNKTDMQYIREARFFQNQGVDGILQLAAVYSVDLKLFGNCLLYPGMEIFIMPYALGGSEFLPQNQGSIANKLGFGGYHIVEKVSSEITAGSFTTNVKALFTYSGDGKTKLYKNGDGAPDSTDVSEPPPNPEKCSTAYNREFKTYRDLLETGVFSAEVTISANENITAPAAPPASTVAPSVVTAAVVSETAGDGQQTVQSLNLVPLGIIGTPDGDFFDYYRVNTTNDGIFQYFDIEDNFIVQY